MSNEGNYKQAILDEIMNIRNRPEMFARDLNEACHILITLFDILNRNREFEELEVNVFKIYLNKLEVTFSNSKITNIEPLVLFSDKRAGEFIKDFVDTIVSALRLNHN
jgi:hypothetical protein